MKIPIDNVYLASVMFVKDSSCWFQITSPEMVPLPGQKRYGSNGLSAVIM